MSRATRARPPRRCSTRSDSDGGGRDLEDELLLDLDLQQPSAVLYETHPDRVEAACALWQRGVVTVEFRSSSPSFVVAVVRRANGVRIGAAP